MTRANQTATRAASGVIYGRLRWDCVRRYVGIERDTWFRIVREEADGLWIEGEGIGDAFDNPGWRFVFRDDFEVRQEEEQR
jgi:hypothetical protein